jgi:hypothetical protein
MKSPLVRMNAPGAGMKSPLPGMKSPPARVNGPLAGISTPEARVGHRVGDERTQGGGAGALKTHARREDCDGSRCLAGFECANANTSQGMAGLLEISF